MGLNSMRRNSSPHETNAASGGHADHEDIVAFQGRVDGPEQRELLRLIGTLVEEHPADT